MIPNREEFRRQLVHDQPKRDRHIAATIWQPREPSQQAEAGRLGIESDQAE